MSDEMSDRKFRITIAEVDTTDSSKYVGSFTKTVGIDDAKKLKKFLDECNDFKNNQLLL